MSTLDNIEPIEHKPSASERVAERLMGLIASGNLAPGDKLPSENEFAKALQVSRPVVREALRGLVMMGIVETKRGGGAYVTDLKPNRLMAPLSVALSLQDYDIDSLFHARDLIDGGIAADAARLATSEQITKLKDLVDAGYRLVGDPVGFRVMDDEFHDLIREAASNDFLHRVSQTLYNLALELRRKASQKPEVLDQSAKDHHAIVKALSARDPEAAKEAMSRHVEHIRLTTLEVKQRAESEDS